VDRKWLARLLPPATPAAPAPAAARASNPESDRNLLFGIMAVQMDFVNRDALIAAMHAWMLAKSKPLSTILVEKGCLGADARTLLEALVDKHLEIHGNDSGQSLGSMALHESVQEELDQFADSELKASLSYVTLRSRSRVDPLATQPLAKRPSSAGSGMRYRTLRPHVEGGLGRVMVARDEELHREVALKEIKEKYADDQECRNRFVMEAEITGGLEHPGIVPVYGLGQYPDGRPFYAMRMIKGESLRTAIDRYHEEPARLRNPGERRVTFRQLLARFIKVCEAVAYAHSRGVLHRDIKPDNIMLGKYGETLVVDWGLAKPVGRGRTAQDIGEVTNRPPSSDNVSATQMGDFVGTPAYMSPEQAEGQLDHLGPRSDVYSLGATLYTLLTGEAPIKGSSMHEIVSKVKSGRIRLPRQVNRETPPGLEAICLKALAVLPEDRYATALELAADIEHWLADESVTAWKEPLWSRTWRWIRRHKAVVTGAAALLVTAVIALAVNTVLMSAQQTHTEQARKKTLQSLELFTKVTQEQLVELPNMEKDLQRISDLLSEIDTGGARDKETPLVHYQLGKAWMRLGLFEAAVEHFQKAIQQFTQLQATSADKEHLYWLALCHNELGETLRHRKSQTAESEFATALKMQSDLETNSGDEQKHRHQIARTHNYYAIWLMENNRGEAAGKHLDEAFSRLKQLTSQNPLNPAYQADLAQVYINRGLLEESKAPGDSIKTYQTAVDILVGLDKTAPTNWENQNRLALAYNNMGQLLNRFANKETDSIRGVLEGSTFGLASPLAAPGAFLVSPHLVAASAPDGPLWHGKQKQIRADAEKRLRQAILLFERLTINFPHHHEYQRGLGLARYNLGELHWDIRQKKDAADVWTKAKLAWGKIADDPGYHEYKSYYGGLLQNLATVYYDKEDWGETRKHLELAVRYQKAAWDLNRENAKYLFKLGAHYRLLLNALVKVGDSKEAESRTADFLKIFRDKPDQLYRASRLLADMARKNTAGAKDSAQMDAYVRILVLLLKDDFDRKTETARRVFAESQSEASSFCFVRRHPAFQEMLQTLQPAKGE
jgi:serine/threonine-protein kinase